ncbi:Transposase [Cordylochernes scorpioides]|uniref:Transposase n=1 Tax=Cordylochernes scorpioides TaxID=51811 RepID=A0ABY6LVC6_9ARAC|nr:Transposase [Cordylochernes scorpioides]
MAELDADFIHQVAVKSGISPTSWKIIVEIFFLVSKDTCNNRECQVIVNGGSSSRQTLLRGGMVIGLKRAGWSIRQIAADTHLGASTVHRLWRRWLEQGNVAIYRNVGATRVTSARVDRRILRQAVAAPQATCTAILQHVQDTLDHSISTRTISRRLVANGLHSCRPLRRLPLTPPNRRQRLEWCRARSTWMTEWHRVVFSDESRFCLSSDSRRVRVWRRRGERSNPAAIVERPTVRQRGIMVWGAIAYDSRSPLLRIQGTMTAQRYVDDVLRPVTLPYLQGVPNALYQQDNARPHTARISQQALQDVQMLPWPPYSPDLSPIEHVWDIIGRRLHALPQLRSEDELWQMVEREWRAIPQDAIRTLIDSLPRRVAACIAVRGGPTCY